MFVGITGAIAVGALISDIVPVLRGIRPAYTIVGEIVILLAQLGLYVPFMFFPLSLVIGIVGGSLHGLYLRYRLSGRASLTSALIQRSIRMGLLLAWMLIVFTAIAFAIATWNIYGSTPGWVYSIVLILVFGLSLLIVERLLMRWFTRAFPQAETAE